MKPPSSTVVLTSPRPFSSEYLLAFRDDTNLPAGPARRSPKSIRAMLALSRGPRNCSAEPARRMEKIGTGLSMLRLAPTKSGLYSPPTPTMTVQLPDTDGTMGNSKGGAGNVKAVWADAESETAAMAARAVRTGAMNVRWAPQLVDEWRPA